MGRRRLSWKIFHPKPKRDSAECLAEMRVPPGSNKNSDMGMKSGSRQAVRVHQSDLQEETHRNRETSSWRLIDTSPGQSDKIHKPTRVEYRGSHASASVRNTYVRSSQPHSVNPEWRVSVFAEPLEPPSREGNYRPRRTGQDISSGARRKEGVLETHSPFEMSEGNRRH